MHGNPSSVTSEAEAMLQQCADDMKSIGNAMDIIRNSAHKPVGDSVFKIVMDEFEVEADELQVTWTNLNVQMAVLKGMVAELKLLKPHMVGLGETNSAAQ